MHRVQSAVGQEHGRVHEVRHRVRGKIAVVPTPSSVEPRPFQEYTDLPQRTVRRVMICDTGGGVIDGVELNPVYLDRLANWMCSRNMFHHHDNEQCRVGAGESCDLCREDAGRLLSECPYIEMNRSPEIKVE
jgi:hypothetical protein